MIKLEIVRGLYSEDERVQEAYERGKRRQVESDAESIVEWLIETKQMNRWLDVEIEIEE